MAKNRGFIFNGSEIYGGLANTFDYGPLGVALKNNIKYAWRKKFIQEQKNNVEIDSSILMNPKVWEASGHLSGFSDPLIDCKSCKMRFRADHLVGDFIRENNIDSVNINKITNDEMNEFIKNNKIKCENCGSSNFTEIREFNLMFKTFMGVIEDEKDVIFLRPETAQGIFVNFNNVSRSTRKKLPFGIGQIGKSFRNEITPGNFIFRTREFEQAELEFFCNPQESRYWFDFWRDFCYKWLLELNIKPENLIIRDHEKNELSHYSSATCDIEYRFPFVWGELWGIAHRGNFDLSQHQKYSGENFYYFDEKNNLNISPHCIEPSVGVDRLLLTFLCDAYCEEKIDNNETRIVLRLHNILAPIKLAILPLSKKLSSSCIRIHEELSRYFSCDFDESGSVGKRYRRQDEIGTPYCATFDFESQKDNCVTIRERDSMKQDRIKIIDIKKYIEEKLFY